MIPICYRRLWITYNTEMNTSCPPNHRWPPSWSMQLRQIRKHDENQVCCCWPRVARHRHSCYSNNDQPVTLRSTTTTATEAAVAATIPIRPRRQLRLPYTFMMKPIHGYLLMSYGTSNPNKRKYALSYLPSGSLKQSSVKTPQLLNWKSN